MSESTNVNGAMPLYEAPASITFRIDYKGYRDVLFTLRGHTGAEVLGKLDKAIEWLDEHGASPTSGQAPAASNNGAAAAQTSAPANDDGEMRELCNRMVITPQPDNKTKVEFYKAGLKFPVVKMIRNEEVAASELAAVTTAPMDKAGDFGVNCYVFYVRGREYEPGKHYKDVTRVVPVAA